MAGDGGTAAQGGSSGVGVSGQSGGSAGMSGGSSGAGGHSGTENSGGSGGGGDRDDAGLDAAIDASMPEPDASMDAGGDGDSGVDGGDATIVEDAEVPDPNGPIAGKVIDYYENPVANVIVRLNGEAVMTNAAGEFEFDTAPATYSISLSLSYQRLGVTAHVGYLFVDLTRRAPTLQIIRGSLRSGDYLGTIQGGSFPVQPRHQMPFDIGGPHGGSDGFITGARIDSSSNWEGPEQVVAHAHVIHYENSSTSPYLPIAYFAHDGESFALDDENETMFTLDLTPGTLPTAIVSGDVANSVGGERTNQVFVRFNDDAAVRVVSHADALESYTYTVPVLSSSSIAIAAERGDGAISPYAVAYVDGVAPGTTDVDLTIPTPPTLDAPIAAQANVDASTVFSWLGDDQVYMFTARASSYYETYYVITAAKSARLPLAEVSVPAFRSNHEYYWSVRTHRRFSTVDEATGPDGYLDSFCYGRLRGPRRGPGTHTATTERAFMSAP